MPNRGLFALVARGVGREDLWITASWFGFRRVWTGGNVRMGAVDGYTDL